MSQRLIITSLGTLAYVHGASIPSVGLYVNKANGALVGDFGINDFDWKYEDQSLADSKKPDEWKDKPEWAKCDDSGLSSKQSPINIVTADAVTPTTDPGALTTTMFDADITGALGNTGRVLRWFAVWGTARPTISGGPLDSDKV